MATQNSKYFAYSSYLVLYIMKTEDLSVSFVFSVRDMIIASICLNPVQKDIIAVAFCTKDLYIIDVAKEKIMNRIITKNVIYTMRWVRKGETLLFHTPSDKAVSTFTYKTSCTEEPLFSSSYAIQFMDSFFINDTIFIFGSKGGNITRLVLEEGSYNEKSISLKMQIVAMECDRQEKSNFLVVGKNGTIYLYDLSDKINEIQIMNSGKEFGAATWLYDPPGHFVNW